MTLLPEDIVSLKRRSKEERFEYLYFCESGSFEDVEPIPTDCLNQWWPSGFKIGEQVFPTAEHFMMHSKALLFGDEATAAEILATPSCREVRDLGRGVENFDTELWREHRFAIVLRANLAKFSQNEVLKDYIFSTGEKILVEVSPADTIWGIGLDEETARKTEPVDWKGLNLLGFALMRTRSLLESGLEYVSEFINLGPPSQHQNTP